MPIVVSVENENGEQTYEAFDPAKHGAELASLPAEVIATHPEYQRLNQVRESVVQESKKFKTRAQTAEQRLQTLLAPAGDNEDEEQDDPPAKPKQKPSANTDEKPLSREEIIRIWDEEQQTRRTAEQTRQQELQGLVTKHKLQNVPDIMDILAGAADPAKTATVLGRSANRFDEVSGGNPELEDLDLEGLNAARIKMGLRPKQAK